ncbi:MAG: hypothetical protein DMF37_10775 [Verrucomicrobia bacterium]|nr:MAG: hypothetical protein DMF37_10775 [Verrucomicrobiota bacterium]
MPRGQGDCRLCPRPLSEGGGGPGPGRRYAFRQHARPAARLHRVSTGCEIKGLKLEGSESEEELAAHATEFLFEPGPEAFLAYLLAHYLDIYLYEVLLNAKASEHSARMVAMKNATDNANEFIKDLTLEYNKMRQAGITTELLEIATAQLSIGA